MPSDLAIVLICVECSVESEEGARNWRALLTGDGEVATFCPECSEREFGGDDA